MEWLNIDWSQVEAWARDQLANNEFLSGGMVVVILTATLNYLRGVPLKVFGFINRKTHTQLNIYNDTDIAYHKMVVWLSAQPKIMKRNRAVHCNGRLNEFGFGTSWFFYRCRFITVSRYRKEDTDTGTLETREGITFRMLGRNQSILHGIVEDSNKFSKPGESKFVSIWRGIDSRWSFSCHVYKRSLESVILAEGQMEKLVDRIKTFNKAADDYTRLGIPHRLGIMLEGPPGTGKTSTILALASHFDVGLSLINISSMTDDDLANLCGDKGYESKPKFVVFEDIDCVFDGREGKSKVTFSGLLNALDGLSSGRNQVTFMTTNHIENLDEALIRPGRVDLRVHLGNIDDSQARRLHAKFFGDVSCDDFVRKFTGQSPATAQDYLVRKYFQ